MRHLELLLITDGGPLLATLARELPENIHHIFIHLVISYLHFSSNTVRLAILYSSSQTFPPLAVHIIDIFSAKMANTLKLKFTLKIIITPFCAPAVSSTITLALDTML